MARIVTVAHTMICTMALVLIGCGSQTGVTTDGTTGLSSTLAVTTSTSALPTTLVPTTIVTLVPTTAVTVAAATTTTRGSDTMQHAVPATTDHDLLVAATKRELRATGNEALYDAEVSKVDVFGSWAVTYVVSPPGYEPGCALFRKVDGDWMVVEGISHQFIETSLIEDGVPKDIVDAIIEAGYPVSPE